LKKSILIMSLLFLNINAADNVWSEETQSLSKEKSDKIIRAYQDGNQSTSVFEDDPKVKIISDVEENILVVGLSLGFGSSEEEVSNTNGAYTTTYTHSNVKFTLGKDFTFWHEEYTQPTRLYMTYSYTGLSTDVDFTTVTVGIKENMRYWPLYETKHYTIFPTLSYEIGNSSLTRGSHDISGLTTEVNGGVVYQRGNFEYIVKLAYNQISWEHPIDGIKDETQSFQFNMGLNYRWMYDE